MTLTLVMNSSAFIKGCLYMGPEIPRLNNLCNAENKIHSRNNIILKEKGKQFKFKTINSVA